MLGRCLREHCGGVLVREVDHYEERWTCLLCGRTVRTEPRTIFHRKAKGIDRKRHGPQPGEGGRHPTVAPSGYCTPREAAAALRVRPSTVTDWALAGKVEGATKDHHGAWLIPLTWVLARETT